MQEAEPRTFLESLARALRTAASYNSADQVAPAAVLWPDGERQWEPLVAQLSTYLPVLQLGEYSPDAGRGPVYWLLCLVAHELEGGLPPGVPPIIYLPGISKQDLRAVEEAPKELQPLAELQYRGALFTQRNGRDWTIAAFIQSSDGGLGIDVGADQATKDAVLRARSLLGSVPMERLRRGAPLRSPFFDELLTPDLARNLLLWIDDGLQFERTSTPEELAAFSAQCKKTYGIDPREVGAVGVAEQLGQRETPAWDLAWQRFIEAPEQYPHMAERLRAARPTRDLGLFNKPDSWPQDNEAAETEVRRVLAALGDAQPALARISVGQLEHDHGPRRSWVWGRLGRAPLARACEHLARLAALTDKPITGDNVVDIVQTYVDWGWQVDDTVMQALACVTDAPAVAAVQVAVRCLYRDWLDQSAHAFQQAVASGDASQTYAMKSLPEQPPGTCIMFVDGLRLDLAHRLSAKLLHRGIESELAHRLAALPTITATAKPAVSPIAAALAGGDALDPVVPASGTTLNVEVLRRLLEAAGYQVLRGSGAGDPSGRAWLEAGDLDEIGHVQPAKLPHLAETELAQLEMRIAELLDAGWQRVTVVTDHGFLLLPGGLPKTELPQHLAENAKMRKGRCARLKDLADVEMQAVPWYWDPAVRIAVPPGIGCFVANTEYEHGGLSLQECVTPVLIATRTKEDAALPASLSVKWRGLRCNFEVANPPAGARADIRTKAGDPSSSLLTGPRTLNEDGRGSAPVEDDSLIGQAAFAVVLDVDDQVIAQIHTVVGGDH